MPHALPPGHPCFFAKEFMDDPFVKDGTDLYDNYSKEKERLIASGDYAKAWEAILQLRSILSELTLHCAELKKAKIEREKSN